MIYNRLKIRPFHEPLFQIDEQVYYKSLAIPGENFYSRFSQSCLNLLYMKNLGFYDAVTECYVSFEGYQEPVFNVFLRYQDIAYVFRDYEFEDGASKYFVCTVKDIRFGLEYPEQFQKIVNRVSNPFKHPPGATVLEKTVWLFNHSANGKRPTGRLMAELTRAGLHNEAYVLDFLTENGFICFPGGRIKTRSRVSANDIIAAHKRYFRQYNYLYEKRPLPLTEA